MTQPPVYIEYRHIHLTSIQLIITDHRRIVYLTLPRDLDDVICIKCVAPPAWARCVTVTLVRYIYPLVPSVLTTVGRLHVTPVI